MPETESEKNLKRPFEIEVSAKNFAEPDLKEQELVSVHIKAKDPLDAVVMAAFIIKALKDLRKEPEVKILP